jgi:hypothetical protein
MNAEGNATVTRSGTGRAQRASSDERGPDAAARAVRRGLAGVAAAPFVQPGLLLVAASLLVGAIFLPLWGMTLVSIQYPEGLRMVVYPTRMAGDLAEINALNRYIGMAQISAAYFGELRVIVGAFATSALLCVAAAALRRRWLTLAPLFVMAGTAAYGFWRMRVRLVQYGHELDPMAPIEIAPFTPPMFGENQIAQFGTYAYFSWGTVLPIVAAVLVGLAAWAGHVRSPQPAAEPSS